MSFSEELELLATSKGAHEATEGLLVARKNLLLTLTVGMFTGRSFVDHTALAAPGVPEEQQYQLLALKNDVVIGQPSPILTVTVS